MIDPSRSLSLTSDPCTPRTRSTDSPLHNPSVGPTHRKYRKGKRAATLAYPSLAVPLAHPHRTPTRVFFFRPHRPDAQDKIEWKTCRSPRPAVPLAHPHPTPANVCSSRSRCPHRKNLKGNYAATLAYPRPAVPLDHPRPTLIRLTVILTDPFAYPHATPD